MVQKKQNTARKIQADEGAKNAIDDASALDYADNMFRDGNNRVARIHNVKAYDNAAHTAEANEDAPYGDASDTEQLLDSNLDTMEEQMPETLLATKQDTSRSRDGTDASGSDDESGGYLGGSTKEVDALEASGAPVDKIPHMKD